MSQSPVALISVTDKRGIISFAANLAEMGFVILSTGGTAKLLRDSNVPVTEVADFTGSPEILDGRVKTLHPKIHAGILADRKDPDHVRQLNASGWRGIDLVIVNLYDFSAEAKDKRLPVEEAIKYIDIGGPCMLRGAAKNHLNTLPVIDPDDYDTVLERLRGGGLDISLRRRLAAKVFERAARYDQMIADYMTLETARPADESAAMADSLSVRWTALKTLRYGENPHQKAALLTSEARPLSGLAAASFLHGKELSYNNYLDLDAAARIVSEFFPTPALTIIKHTNPCGTAASAHLTVTELFNKALSGDPKCAFGGIIAANVTIDAGAARAMSEIFLECVIAPAYTPEALAILTTRKNLRVLSSDCVTGASKAEPPEIHYKTIRGGMLAQTAPAPMRACDAWTCVSKAKPNPEILAELTFAMTVCKHVKSNAIVLASDNKTIGVGAGQMSRIDSTRFAIEKAREMGHTVKGSVLASDAFFPFRDCVDLAAKSGIQAIVQPGGSVRDQESIDAADEHGIVLMFSGDRYFTH